MKEGLYKGIYDWKVVKRLKQIKYMGIGINTYFMETGVYSSEPEVRTIPDGAEEYFVMYSIGKTAKKSQEIFKKAIKMLYKDVYPKWKY